MAKRKIAFDQTEIIMAVIMKLEFGKEKPKIIHATYDEFLRISILPCEEKKLFKTVPSEKISVKLKKYKDSFEFTKMTNKDFYDEYKKGFIKFAKDNRIELINEVD